MKKWNIPKPIEPDIASALNGYPSVIQQILANRGKCTPEAAYEYFHPQPRQDEDLQLMSGMKPAVDRILKAIERGEKVAIYGDYDVDGVTATALLVEALTHLGGSVSAYIPDRFEEGYGINKDALAKLKADGVSLVISVDCGVRSFAEAAYSHTIGLDLIITDHHTPQAEVPAALAVIDPKLDNDLYPFKYLAGVGVAYKLVRALFIHAHRLEELGERWLDLVAIGSVADMAPLEDENRYLVRAGLEVIHKTDRVGLQELCQVAGIQLQSVDSTSIGFTIGPRLNAAGRLDNALIAYDLLTETVREKAGELASRLNQLNQERQVETRNVVEQATTMIDGVEDRGLLLYAVSPDFSEGIVGLAAARLMEKYYRPVVVGTDQGETIRCSCRSIPEVDITSLLDECADLMIHHGGHRAAAGFTILAKHFPELKQRMEASAERILAGKELVATINVEMVIKLEDVKANLYDALQMMQPTGYGNPASYFVIQKLRLKTGKIVGQDGRHLKLWLTNGFNSINAIAFGFGSMLTELQKSTYADYLFTIDKNEYNGNIDYQMNVKDIHITPAG